MNDKLLNLWHNPKREPILIGLLAFGAGAGVGYFLAMKRKTLETHSFTKTTTFSLDEDELAKVRDAAKSRRGTVVIPPITGSLATTRNVDAGEAFVKEVLAPTVIVPHPDEVETELVTKSIFADDDWDYDKEVASRTTMAPYVLHKDEFYADEKGYTQLTLTYYAGDSILVDQDDAPIYNHELITGPLLFGHGSSDPNVVHVRNDDRKAEYEILFDPGLYSVEVLGLEIENTTREADIRHSKLTRFRDE